MNLSNIQDEPIIILTGLLVLLAMYSDLRWRKIPNCLTLPAIALGFLVNFLGNGWNGLIFAFFGSVSWNGSFDVALSVRRYGGRRRQVFGSCGRNVGKLCCLECVSIYYPSWRGTCRWGGDRQQESGRNVEKSLASFEMRFSLPRPFGRRRHLHKEPGYTIWCGNRGGNVSLFDCRQNNLKTECGVRK
ncbi:MAG: hypothetical protein GTO24_19735 [candidate division Zixibacteria bacterium]|nr:hypothetical protein [candidate division Zixibacteria bacterium]